MPLAPIRLLARAAGAVLRASMRRFPDATEQLSAAYIDIDRLYVDSKR